MRFLPLILSFCFSLSLPAQVATLLGEATSAAPSRQAEIAVELRAYRAAEFTANDRRKLIQLAGQRELGGRADFLLLLGFLGERLALEELAREPDKTDPVKRAINLARVRAGDADRRANLLKNVRRYPVDDEFNFTVLPLLTYTRQREVLDYLWERLITENKACSPADAETSGRIDCAYRIAEALAPVIVDFPVGYDEEGNLLTDDYAAALAEIRRWYAAHAKDYGIKTDTY